MLAETAAAFIPEALMRTLFNGITAMLVQPAVQQPWLTWMQAFQMGVAVGVLSLCLLFGAICLFRGRPTQQPVVVHIPVQQPAPEHRGNSLRRSPERLKGQVSAKVALWEDVSRHCKNYVIPHRTRPAPPPPLRALPTRPDSPTPLSTH